MITIRFHFIYISVIAFLGYSLWAEKRASQQIFEAATNALANDYTLINSSNQDLKLDIDRWVSTSLTKYRQYKKKSDSLSTTIRETLSFLNSATLNKIYSVDEIKEKLNSFSLGLYQLVNKKEDSLYLSKYYQIHKFLMSDTLKMGITKTPKLYLQMLKNTIKRDEIIFNNYIMNSVSRNEIRFDAYKLMIVPSKGTIIEGENFEADVFLTPYAVTTLPNASQIFVNNQKLDIIDGNSRFIRKETHKGTKTVKATMILKNPYTDEASTCTSMFEYQVLPKCSIDCNKKQ